MTDNYDRPTHYFIRCHNRGTHVDSGIVVSKLDDGPWHADAPAGRVRPLQEGFEPSGGVVNVAGQRLNAGKLRDGDAAGRRLTDLGTVFQRSKLVSISAD